MPVTDALKHLAGNFSPAYPVERIEDMTEGMGGAALSPRRSLGRGQLFAAKPTRMFRFDIDGQAIPASDWISP